jgi:hypothetical protein
MYRRTRTRAGATRTTCTIRASPVRSRCRRARPCGSRPAAAAGPTPRRPSRRASPPRRPMPAPRSSTCVENKVAQAWASSWLFRGCFQRQSMARVAPSWPLCAGRPHRPRCRHGPVLAESPAHVALVDVLDQPLERLQLGCARRVRIGRVLRRDKEVGVSK